MKDFLRYFALQGGPIALLWTGALTLTSLAALAQPIIVNPSFEADKFSIPPGTVGKNFPITGWNSSGGAGINPYTTDAGSVGSPFADNGVIPDGLQVAFIQWDSTLSQVVNGFAVGAWYQLQYFENARTGSSTPSLEVAIGGQTIVAKHAISPVGDNNPYVKVTSLPFMATASSMQLDFIKTGRENGGDNTALIDEVTIQTATITGPFVKSFSPNGGYADSDAAVNIVLQDSGTLVNANSIQLLFDGSQVLPAISKSGNLTTVRYLPVAPLAPGSSNWFTLTYQDSGNPPATNSVQGSFQIYPIIPANLALPVALISTNDTGFRVKSTEADPQIQTDVATTLAQAEMQLAGTLINPTNNLPYTNVADLTFATNVDGTFTVPGVLNFGATYGGGKKGNFTVDNGYTDELFSDVGIDPAGAQNAAMEIVAYLALPAGTNTFGINSGDGFKLTTALDPHDPNGLLLGSFDGPRADEDSIFSFIAPKVGIYPFRLVWFEGYGGGPRGGGSIEWFSVDSSGKKILINDSSNPGSIKAYRTALLPPRPVGQAVDLVTNPSFEADHFSIPPGTVGKNTAITGWKSSGGAGINPYTTDAGATGSPFANNGTIPDGQQVAFIQWDSTFGQVISGLEVGARYYVEYYENARTGSSLPYIEVRIGANTIVNKHAIRPVGGTSPYVKVTSEIFIATSPSMELDFLKTGRETGGDNTALIDDVALYKVVETGPTIQSLSPAGGFANANASVNIVLQDGATQVDTSSIQLIFNNATVRPMITKAGGATTISYTPSSPLPGGSVNSFMLTFADTGAPPTPNSVQGSFEVYPMLSATLALPPSAADTNNPGFTVKSVESSTSTELAPSVARAEVQLAGKLIDPATGLPYVNTVDMTKAKADGTFAISGVLNLGATYGGGKKGNFTVDNGYTDELFSDVGIDPAGAQNAAMEIVAYLDLPAGTNTFGINSGDGFKLTSALDPHDPNGLLLASFDGPRPDEDSIFSFITPQAGLYPFRLVWFEGYGGGPRGGGSVEWFSVDSSGKKILINDSSNLGSIKAYSSASEAPRGVALRISLANDKVSITWTGSAVLQVAADVTGPWADVSGATSPYTATLDAPHRFFRLRQ